EYGIIDLIKSVARRQSTPLSPTAGCNFNLPGSVTQHYHVDSNFTDDFMIANVALVDTDLRNGAIEIIPKSHKKFYKYWRFALERPQRFSRRVPMRQGDVLVRTSSLWHRGMPNRTTAARPMLAFTFVPKTGPAAAEDPFLFNGGKMKFYENW